MGVFAGPDLSENGLVLCLDAGNVKGYDKYENLRTNSNTGGFFPVVGSYTSTGTSTDILAPDGSNTTYKVVASGTQQSTIDIAYLQITLTAGVTYTVSVYYYATGSTTSSRNIGIQVFGNSAANTTFTLPQNTWVRQSLTFTPDTTWSSGQIRVISNDYGTFNSQSGATVYLWGAQLEIGSSVTDYYATTSTAKNRGTTLTDLTGRGNTGTLTNGPTFNNSNGGSLVFDGTDDYVDISNATNLNNLGSQDFTVSMWVYRATNPPSGNGEMLYQSATLDNGFVICISDNDFRIELRDNASTNSTVAGILDVFTANIWNNLVLTKQGTTYTGYSQGTSKGSLTSYQDVGTDSGFINIGRVSWWGPSHWEGNIAQVQVYNRALSAQEIRQNFNANRGRFGI